VSVPSIRIIDWNRIGPNYNTETENNSRNVFVYYYHQTERKEIINLYMCLAILYVVYLYYRVVWYGDWSIKIPPFIYYFWIHICTRRLCTIQKLKENVFRTLYETLHKLCKSIGTEYAVQPQIYLK